MPALNSGIRRVNMGNYTETSFQFLKLVDGKTTGIVTIVVDTEEDIPTEIPDRWETGSLCFIAETHKCKVLNHNREWK